jgi:hypothetical protein
MVGDWVTIIAQFVMLLIIARLTRNDQDTLSGGNGVPKHSCKLQQSTELFTVECREIIQTINASLGLTAYIDVQ